MSRRPVFIVSTEGKSNEQMKADARGALRRAEDGAMMWPFAVDLVGHERQRFMTLQEAMSHAESIDKATGTVACHGFVVVSYQSGAVALSHQFAALFPTLDPPANLL